MTPFFSSSQNISFPTQTWYTKENRQEVRAMLSFQLPNFEEISFELDHDSNGTMNRHAQLELLFVLSGSIEVFLLDRHQTLQEKDLMVINSFELHSIQQNPDSHVLSMMIDLSRLSGWKHGAYFCISPQQTEKISLLRQLRQQYAECFRLFYKNAEANRLAILSCVYQAVDILERGFAAGNRTTQIDEGTEQRIRRIVQYINENYQKDLTLAALAEQEYISAAYLSRFMQKHLGMPFSKYLRTIRLNQAYRQLLNTQKSVMEISMETGFPSSNAFIECFKQTYGQTPGVFRRTQARKSDQSTQVLQNEIFQTLLQYANNEIPESHTEIVPDCVAQLSVDTQQQGRHIHHHFRDILNAGYANDLLLEPIQRCVRKCQQEIGFHYLRIHGILDDEMRVYNEDSLGNPVYNFTFVDMIFDFALSLKLTPYIQLGYMPSKLARPNCSLLRRSCLSMPTEIKKWNRLIEHVIEHFIQRYGINEVKQWRFVPLTAVPVFYGDYSMEEYLELYENTRRIIKHFHPDIQVGGPQMDLGVADLEGFVNIKKFLTYSIQHDCTPDFISFQCFHVDYSIQPKDIKNRFNTHQEEPAPISADIDYLSHTVDKLQAIIRSYQLDNLPLILDCWNSTIWQKDLCNDTCYKAAFLAKNILQNEHKLQGFGFWHLTDFLEEVTLEKHLYHGMYGLFTYNGIPKAGYLVYQLLRLLGNYVLTSGEGYTITRVKGRNEIQIMLYHYCHYDALSRNHYIAEKLEDNTLNRYYVFQDSRHILFRFLLTNLDHGQYEIETYSINRDHGSSFDDWIHMGAPIQMKPRQIQYLSDRAHPEYQWASVECTTGTIELSPVLQPHEVKVIVLRQK